MPFIAALVAALLAALATALGSFLIRGFLALGLGFVTYNFILPPFLSFITSTFLQLPPTVMQVMAVCKVDVLITMIFSAIVVRFSAKTVLRHAATS